jgi:hypothetical protein
VANSLGAWGPGPQLRRATTDRRLVGRRDGRDKRTRNQRKVRAQRSWGWWPRAITGRIDATTKPGPKNVEKPAVGDERPYGDRMRFEAP